jgi:hypothetical protein
MTRRKELKGIASGLYGTFISRYNDIGGYWGIGKLCLHAQQQGSSRVMINLLNDSIDPPSSEFGQSISNYRAFLFDHMASCRIPVEWVTSANIELTFDADPPEGKVSPIYHEGSLFNLLVDITDDRGKHYTISGYSYCWPHDPKKESKSGR